MLNLLFKWIQDKEEETEEEINYPFQVTLPAKDSERESADETSSDSASDENLPGLLGVIAKRSKESHNLTTSEKKFNFFVNDEFNNPNFVSYVEMINQSEFEWAIELAKKVQSNQNISKISSKEKINFAQSNKFESFKFKSVSRRSPRIIRNLQNELKIEPAMGEAYIPSSDSNFHDFPSFYTSKNSFPKTKRFPVDDSSDDILFYK